MVSGLVAALAVGAGGTLGALARYAVDDRLGGDRGTVAVNVLGSVALGVVVSVPTFGGTGAGRIAALELAAGTGFCGAFTTFSSHAVAVETFADDGRPLVALAYAGGTLAAALVGVALGSVLAGALP